MKVYNALQPACDFKNMSDEDHLKEDLNYLDIDDVSEPFFFAYVKSLKNLYRSTMFCAAFKVLLSLLELSEYNSGRIILNSTVIADILEECKLSRSSYQRAISDLLKEGVLIKDNSGYMISPKYFWKGAVSRRNKAVGRMKKLI